MTIEQTRTTAQVIDGACHAARRLRSTDHVGQEMKDRGFEFISNEPKSAADLVRPVRRLLPLGVVKG